MNILKEVYKRGNNKLKERLIFFLNNSDISGLRFLSDKYGVSGRIFWGIAIVVSLYGMIRIFNLTAERFDNDDISIGIDTAYLHWVNTFPAVSICLVKGRNSKLLTNYIETENISHPNTAVVFSRIIYKYLFTTPNELTELQSDCKELNSTCGVDFEILTKRLLPTSCKDVITAVKFNGKLYENCEEIFKFHKTEMGFCFIANSIIDYDYDVSKVPLKFTIETDDRSLQLIQKPEKFWINMVCIHSPEDLPYFNTECGMMSTDPFLLNYNVEEIINEDAVKDARIDHRFCRFPEEKLPNSTFHYSFSTCMSDLRIKVELETCNCTLPSSPEKYKDLYCDIYGIDCLARAEINDKVKLMHSLSVTACIPSCNEQRITKVGENEIRRPDIPGGTIIIEISNLPTVRYIRHVTKTKLDLVVAIGGVAGLFFGASILNIVEIIYIWFIRKI